MKTHRDGINRELIYRLVSDIREAVYRVEELTRRPFDSLGFYERLALRYLIIELVEASAAICVHLLRRLRGVEADSYSECFSKMGELDLIPRDLAERLARAARLRNLVVHKYWVIDDRRLYEVVKTGIRDFEDYASIAEEAVRSEAGAETSQDHTGRETQAD